MAQQFYGEGGEYFEDDPSLILMPTDQAAAEFLQILDEIEPVAQSSFEPLYFFREDSQPQVARSTLRIRNSR